MSGLFVPVNSVDREKDRGSGLASRGSRDDLFCHASILVIASSVPVNSAENKASGHSETKSHALKSDQ